MEVYWRNSFALSPSLQFSESEPQFLKPDSARFGGDEIDTVLLGSYSGGYFTFESHAMQVWPPFLLGVIVADLSTDRTILHAWRPVVFCPLVCPINSIQSLPAIWSLWTEMVFYALKEGPFNLIKMYWVIALF